jgi:hypothetical protein
MADAWIDVGRLTPQLSDFFDQNRGELSRFGTTINQTFEAYVIAQTIAWFKAQPDWTVEVISPRKDDGSPNFRLKFSTRGRPGSYTYVRCTNSNGESHQIRHQLRVATRHHRNGRRPSANVCLDVAIIHDLDLSEFKTYDCVSNDALISFGEAKHMSAFAELIAGFVGLVHELQPERLRRIRKRRTKPQPLHPSPFLFVSGHLWQTAEGLVRTIEDRRYDIDVYTSKRLLAEALPLPTGK